jgi:hypothetical protein
MWMADKVTVASKATNALAIVLPKAPEPPVIMQSYFLRKII